MKKNQQRDLLVLLNNEYKSEHALNHEVEWLHDVLFHVEALDNFCIAHEIINVNRRRLITQPRQIKKSVLRKTEKAFEFLSNKN
ncbi:MAG: hypothetical protein K2X48_14155 [Chitinophagaceae bacterium]|nr:hypothetical protein [Chitinophagaceae bacterium]